MAGKCIGKNTTKIRRVREDYIEIDAKEIVWQCAEWIHLAPDRGRRLAVLRTVRTFWFHEVQGFS